MKPLPVVPSTEAKKKWKLDGKRTENLKIIGLIWHEGIHGRYDEDVTSTVLKALRHPQYRDAKEIVIWADNCTGQLKNADAFHSQVEKAMKMKKNNRTFNHD